MSKQQRQQAKELAHWQCQLCDRPCRQRGEAADTFIQRIGDRYWQEVTLKRVDGSYIAVCASCAMALIRPSSDRSIARHQRQQEILHGQMRLPGM